MSIFFERTTSGPLDVDLVEAGELAEKIRSRFASLAGLVAVIELLAAHIPSRFVFAGEMKAAGKVTLLTITGESIGVGAMSSPKRLKYKNNNI